MKIKIEGPIKIEKDKDKKASDILKEALENALNSVKIKVPFKADGFKSEKTPIYNNEKIVPEEAGIKSAKGVESSEKKEVEDKKKKKRNK